MTLNQQRNMRKMVAANALRANQNIMSELGEHGVKNRVLWLTLKRECEEIMKHYPSLR